MSTTNEIRKLAEEVRLTEAARVEAEAAVPKSRSMTEDENKVWICACGEVWKLENKLAKLALKLAAAVLAELPSTEGG